jgi:hypothetical protein
MIAKNAAGPHHPADDGRPRTVDDRLPGSIKPINTTQHQTTQAPDPLDCLRRDGEGKANTITAAALPAAIHSQGYEADALDLPGLYAALQEIWQPH